TEVEGSPPARPARRDLRRRPPRPASLAAPRGAEEPRGMTSTTPSAAAGISLEVRGLRKLYGTRAAVDDLSFVCAPGTVTGFLGPNGAGKSTTLRILTGLARADAGEALVCGRSFRSLPRRRGAGDGRAEGRRRQAGRRLLLRDAPAARHRRGPDR